MTQYPKRLIEVDLPIKRISAHARREKSIRHGHISTLHIWWARRPLAACRAVICASLWIDPADELCPQIFRDRAAEIVIEFAKKAATDKDLSDKCSSENWSKWQSIAKSHQSLDSEKLDGLKALREALLDFIADFANWDNSTQPDYLETARALTQAAHEALGGEVGTRPLVVDPFAGGGSIPLEALRVGADAFASDLNPVAVLLNKVVLEYIPKYGQRLADEVRKWGQWVKEEAEKELAEFYPKDEDGSTPIAYLWARTIISEAPDDGTGIPVEVPLMRSLWLAKKAGRYKALRWVRDASGVVQTETVEVTYADGVTRQVRRPLLEIFEPKSEKEVEKGTVARGSGTCPVTGYTTPVASVRRQIVSRWGGTNDARLICIITTNNKDKKRYFRLSTANDYRCVGNSYRKLKDLIENHCGTIDILPNEPMNQNNSNLVSGRGYGFTKWSELFSYRQLLSLTTFVRLVSSVNSLLADEEKEFVTAVQACLGLVIDRVADRCSSFCRYDPSPTMSGINNTFSRQAISMIWDFAEGDPTSKRSGGWEQCLEWLVNVIHFESVADKNIGDVELASATDHPLPDDFAQAFISDPPYYDAIEYSDLSDFFYVWLKRSLPKSLSTFFTEELTPKKGECIVSQHRNQNKVYFETTMAKAMFEGQRVLSPDGVGIIVFAHKSTSGWESQLQAMVNAGWIVTGSWAIDTEMGTRMNARNAATLASSVHLVCRPRSNNEIGDWRDVLQKLPKRIHEWMPRLAEQGVVGADAIFACLGPALEIFSRYSSVEKASGEIVPLREYLEYVWAAISKEALSTIFKDADTSSFEEDARLTAMWLWTLSTGETETSKASTPYEEEISDDEDEEGSASKKVKITGFVLEYDAARKIAQGLGVHLETLTHLVEVKGNKARLLPVKERSAYLFGKEGTIADTPKKTKGNKQLTLAGILDELPEDEYGEIKIARIGETICDKVHQAMLLFNSGRSEALKRFLVNEGIGSDARFWQLAQSFLALYPTGSDEKRWVDGLLARKKGLGL
ncbi:DUF1156 domain-containing protein [Merismopedia glauca]|uniref:Adenine-specific DNA methylase n=1 Tax=Merismopedia glauca CCAP 1448/3 TaxID=1296344 RepID=A0A2T1C2C1_9CYAN|nr:DUF1156 domain-containing protein [Merismopedia glauca]PSB02354.1 adenine-specific DNA methylase [Merismopedia glauca CCAP 1448/3]